MSDILAAEQEANIAPLKFEFRRKLIEELREAGLDKVERVVRTEAGKVVELSSE